MSSDHIKWQGVKAIVSVLDKVEEIAENNPPLDNSGSRFGNPAFRSFYDKVSEVCPCCDPTRFLLKGDL